MAIVVIAAVAARRCRAPAPTPVLPPLPTEVLDSGPPPPNSSPFERPLRGPIPPPPAEVPTTAARTLHGGPHRTHRVDAHGPRTANNVAWRIALDGGVAAQVTVAPDEQTLYVATLGGQMHALSRVDGSRRWSVNLGDRGYGAPLVHDDGTIYVGSDDKKLFAISKTGGTIFRLEMEHEVDTSAVFSKTDTIVFAAGNHVCSVRRGGDLAWRFRARKKVYTSPAITEDGLVIVGSQDHHVYALKPNGTLAWRVDLGADVDGGPAIGDDGSIHVGTDSGEVVRLDAQGGIVWRTQVRGFVRGTLSIARNGDVLAGTYGPVPRVVRVAPDGTVRGAFPIRGTGAREFGIHGGPLEDADGTLYFGAQDDAVYAVGADGAQRWRFETGGDVDAPLTMLSDGSLVIPSEAGTVTLLLP